MARGKTGTASGSYNRGEDWSPWETADDEENIVCALVHYREPPNWPLIDCGINNKTLSSLS